MTNNHKNKTQIGFYAVGISIPIIFFLFLESVLRVVGFGQSVPLFIENPANPNYLVTRPDLMTRYFPFSKNPPSVTMEADFLLKDKPDNGFRVFVQGGSTAAGFPYGLGASLAGTLEHRLRQSMPTKHVEVVNTAMSAVNSHTLLDIADDIIEQQPDMVLIYAGHNEFLGILGAGSNFATSQSYWLTRIMLNLKNWRIYQLFQWLYASFQAPIAPSPNSAMAQENRTSNRTTMMAKVAAGRSIEFNSPTYQAALHQFKRNISKLLTKYKDAGIPVFISSIASNYKDQPPFKSVSVEPKFENLVQKLTQLMRTPSAQNNDLSQIKQIALALKASESALLHFELGKFLLSKSLNKQANTHFELAIQHDQLKFRGPKEMNAIIREAANNYQANFVDAKSFFTQRSQHQIVGNELMLEHLHPNLQGYYVINEAFYQAISRLKPVAQWQNIGISQAWRERLILPSEEYAGFASVTALMADYPFVDKPQPLELPAPADPSQSYGLEYFKKQISWQQMIEKNLEYYRLTNNKLMTLKSLLILADALPHHGLYNAQAADALSTQNPELATYYRQRAKRAGLVDIR